jgi:hypothetical protein
VRDLFALDFLAESCKFLKAIEGTEGNGQRLDTTEVMSDWNGLDF